MKKIKIYKTVVDEFDIIYEITNLLNKPLKEEGYDFVSFNLSDLEYEDDDHIFHYANELCVKCLLALGFESKGSNDHIYTKGSYTIGFTSLYEQNAFIIQRQS